MISSCPIWKIEHHYLSEGKAESRTAKEPYSIHAFERAVKNQIRYWGMLFGRQHERARAKALDFLTRLHDDTPDLFCVNFLVMTWEEMTRDYVDKTVECVRRLGQLGHAGDKQADLYRAATTPSEGSRTPMWKYPATFDMEGKGGYWRRVVLPRMEKEVGKTWYKSALSKILFGWGTSSNDRQPVKPKGDAKPDANQYGAIAKRHYPAGRRLPASERNLAMTHGPVAKDKKGICWDFSAHSGCSRGAACSFIHSPFLPTGLHWAVECEMIRRGGHRKGEKYPPEIVDAKVQSVRAANSRVPGEQDPSSQVNAGPEALSLDAAEMCVEVTSDIEKWEQEYVNLLITQELEQDDGFDEMWDKMLNAPRNVSASSGIPDDFKTFSCAALENGLRNILEADTEWVSGWQGKPAQQTFMTEHKCTPEEQGLNLRWKERHGTLSARISPKLKQLITQSDLPLEDGLKSALGTLSNQGIKADADEASIYLAKLNNSTSCGETTPGVVWDVVAEAGDVWIQQVCIGNLNMDAVDYGDQLTLGKPLQQAFGEGEPLERNQCTIVSLAAALEWHAQKWKKRIPSRNRVGLLATTIREAEFAAAQQGVKDLGKIITAFDAEVDTAPHDILNPNHARDLRTIGFFLLNEILVTNDVDVCIFEINSPGTPTMAHVFRGAGGSDRELVFLLAFKNHMRWEKTQ